MEPEDGRRRRAYLVSLLAAAAVVAALLALPWHRYAVSVKGAGSFALDRNGVQTPDARSGEAALAVAVLVGAYAAAALVGPPRLAARLRQADGWLRWAGIALFLLVGFKLLSDTDFLGAGAWTALVLSGAVVAAGRRLGSFGG